ncbi:unnamed protein product, partial [marine sediment metagenome]
EILAMVCDGVSGDDVACSGLEYNSIPGVCGDGIFSDDVVFTKFENNTLIIVNDSISRHAVVV